MLLQFKEQFSEFSASLLQPTVSHDPSEITLYWFAAQETCLIIFNVENSGAAEYFCGNHDTMKEQLLFK